MAEESDDAQKLACHAAWVRDSLLLGVLVRYIETKNTYGLNLPSMADFIGEFFLHGV